METKFVQAVDDVGSGQVHEADCYVVTKVWPGLNWQPVPGPAMCGHCVARQAKEGR